MKGMLSKKKVGEKKEFLDPEIVRSEIMARISKTIHQRSNDFLHLSEETLKQYISLYSKFVKWFLDNKLVGQDIGSEGMAKWWMKFLKETGTNDVIESSNVDVGKLSELFSSSSYSSSNIYGSMRILLTTHGIPGDGKVCIWKKLMNFFSINNYYFFTS
jgi:hypothetical protein